MHHCPDVYIHPCSPMSCESHAETPRRGKSATKIDLIPSRDLCHVRNVRNVKTTWRVAASTEIKTK